MSGTGRHRDEHDRAGATRAEPDDGSFTVERHEERAEIGTELHETGRARVRKHVDTYPVEQVVPRDVERADTSERVPAAADDSGEVETLEDGSVSIPVFEEVLVVTKKLVVRERVIVRKTTVTDDYVLQTDLRREHVSVETDGEVDVADRREDRREDRPEDRRGDRPDDGPADRPDGGPPGR